MQESLEEGDTEITFNNINFEESLLNKMLVDPACYTVEKISRLLSFC
jgi:hypothetical protein